MKKYLSLKNENAIALYNFLQNKKVDRVKNRARWKFLDVIEEVVLKFEKDVEDKRTAVTQKQDALKITLENKEASNDEKIRKAKEFSEYLKEINKEIKDLSDAVSEFEFSDREIFAQGKAIFESIDEDLTGRDGKMYKEIEDAFLNVREVEKPAN